MQTKKLLRLAKVNFIFSRYCSQKIMKKLSKIQEASKWTAKKRSTHLYKLNEYFNSESHLKEILPLIPAKYLSLKRMSSIESLYLVDSEYAKKVGKAVLPYLKVTPMLICETSPGFGLITDYFLHNSTKVIRLYEPCSEFRKYLKEHHKNHPYRIQLFMKDIFQLARYSIMDKFDNYKRVDQLLDGIPIKRWKDTPSMTIVGPSTKTNFLSFILKALCLQSKVFDNGRIQLFLMMRPGDYLKITSRPEHGNSIYGSISILFTTFFKQKLLLEIPRKSFLPWEMVDLKKIRSKHRREVDRENIYLVRITPKAVFPLAENEMQAFYYFIKQFYSRRTNKVIPSLEKWVPGCGFNILLPQLKHLNYYKDMNIYTTFGDLQPDQALAIFKEMINHPDYGRSSFAALVQSQLLKSETIENSECIDDINKDMLDDFMENKDL